MRLIIVFIILTLTLSVSVSGKGPMGGHFFLFSWEKSYVSRIDFASAGGTEVSIGEPDMTTSAFNIGLYKNLYRNRLSLRVYVTIGSGEGTQILKNRPLMFADSSIEFHDLSLNQNHSFLGVVPELMYYIPFSRRMYPYVFVGAGYNNYEIKSAQNAVVRDNSNRKGSIVPLGEAGPAISTECFNINTGLGFNWFITYYFGFFAQYKFRYWTPLSTKQLIVENTFLDTRETHYCNIAEIGLLFRL